MNTLLRIYLVLIFASSAFDAGSENDSINKGFSIEASNFAKNPSYPQRINEIADCFNFSVPKEIIAIKEGDGNTISE